MFHNSIIFVWLIFKLKAHNEPITHKPKLQLKKKIVIPIFTISHSKKKQPIETSQYQLQLALNNKILNAFFEFLVLNESLKKIGQIMWGDYVKIVHRRKRPRYEYLRNSREI